MEKSTTPVSYMASLSVAGLSLTVNEFVALAGLAVAVATFLINWRYKHLRYRLEREALHVPEKPHAPQNAHD